MKRIGCFATWMFVCSLLASGCGSASTPQTINHIGEPRESTSTNDSIVAGRPPGAGGKSKRQQYEALTGRLAKYHEASADEKAQVINDVALWLTNSTIDDADVQLADRAIMVLDRDESGMAQEFARTVSTKFELLSAKVQDADWIVGWAQRQLLHDSPLLIEGTTIQGESFSWTDYRGKVVLVEFWATWCGPCHREMAGVLALYDQYHDVGFDVVGVATDENLSVVQSFVRNADLPWATIHSPADSANSLSRQFGVRAIPSGILVDRRGHVISIQPYGEELERLLAEQFGQRE